MKNGRCRMHGGPSPGAPRGNKNAFKHSLYTAGSIAQRKYIAGLIGADAPTTSRGWMELPTVRSVPKGDVASCFKPTLHLAGRAILDAGEACYSVMALSGCDA
jgi:hypothetical protein